MLHLWSLNIRPQEKLPGEVLEVLENENEEGEGDVLRGLKPPEVESKNGVSQRWRRRG